eukprot:scaffold159674_cov81-Cyclotella_meneghiniana.AAC.2
MTDSYHDSQDNPLLDDTFDADESLLVSPAPKAATEDQSNPANEPNVSVFSDSSDSFSHTPVKPKFSYASCMNALDSLVPSAMKAKSAAKRRATMFSLEHSSAKKSLCSGGRLNDSLEYSTLGDNDSSFVAESNNVCFSARLGEDVDESIEMEHKQSIEIEIGNKNQLTEIDFGEEIINKDAVDESNQEIVVLGTNGSSDLDAPPANEFEGLESYDSSQSIKLEENIEQNLDLVEGNHHGGKKDDMATCETAALRICIQNVGHPVNESCDRGMSEKIDTELSMKVEHDAVGTIMDEKYRFMDKPGTFSENCYQSSETNVDFAVDGEPYEDGGTCFKNVEMYTLDDSAIGNAFGFGLGASTTNESSEIPTDRQNCSEVANDLCDNNTIDEDGYDGALIHHNLQTDAAAPPMGQVTALNTDGCPFDLNPFEHETLNSSNDRAEDITPPSLTAFSGACLSPIAKSSSPHNCDANELNTHQLIALKDTTMSTESAPTHLESIDPFEEYKTTLSGVDPIENHKTQHEEQTTHRGTIFDVLSHSGEEYSDSVAHQYINQNESIESSTSVTEQQDAATPKNASLPNESLSPSASLVTSSDADQPTIDALKNKSLGDLASFQDASNALLQKLRATAETRKREATRCRYSLERKEQLLMDEKESRSSMTTVDESQSVGSPRNTIAPTKPKKKFEGLDPYKPFVAKPMALAKSEGPSRRESSISLSAPKSATALPHRKKLAPGEDPYKPFKAQLQNTSTGTKRKMSAALRHHPEQNHSNKPAASTIAKPPTRLLSGCAASTAKENSLQERIEKQNEGLRRDSVFKARRMPRSSPSTAMRLKGEKLLEVSDKENNASTDKRISSVRPFTPHSTSRARDRAVYDSERAQREKTVKIDRKKKRQIEVDNVKEEIEHLKSCIR